MMKEDGAIQVIYTSLASKSDEENHKQHEFYLLDKNE